MAKKKSTPAHEQVDCKALLAEYPNATERRKRVLEGILVQANMPFVKQRARKFQKKTAIDVDLEDLHQAGAIGLLTAIRRYNGKFAFTTYAAWWVFWEMKVLATKTHPIKRPKDAGLPYKKFRELEAWQTRTGEMPEDADLQLKPGSIEEWRQTPVFFTLTSYHASCKTHDEDDRYADLSPNAEEVLLQEEREERDIAALESLTEEELALLTKAYSGNGTKEECERVVGIVGRLYERRRDT